jgi:hypothetical protein
VVIGTVYLQSLQRWPPYFSITVSIISSIIVSALVSIVATGHWPEAVRSRQHINRASSFSALMTSIATGGIDSGCLALLYISLFA